MLDQHWQLLVRPLAPDDVVAAFRRTVYEAGQIYEGVVLAIDDAAAVATTYRPGVHQSLMAMATLDSGQSTAHLGWDLNAWVGWYNDVYLPLLAKRAEVEPPTRDPQ